MATKPLPGNSGYAIRRALAASITAAAKKGVANMTKDFAGLVAGLRLGNKSDIAEAHRDVARYMRERVRERYNETVESQRLVPSYHRTNRLSGGLSKAIDNDNLAVGSAEGIAFVHLPTMNKEAAHWRRLNFGAGSIAGPAEPNIPLRVFGQYVGTLGFRVGASPGFNLPPGFFRHGITNMIPKAEYRGSGTTGMFFPNRRSPYQGGETVGIRGRHFLEAGLEALSEALEPRYDQLIRKWLIEDGKVGRKIRTIIA